MHFSTCGYLVTPTPFIEEATLSPLCVLHTFVKVQLNVNMWVKFWSLYSVPLVYRSVSSFLFFFFLERGEEREKERERNIHM